MGTVASARHQTPENWDIDETDLAAINQPGCRRHNGRNRDSHSTMAVTAAVTTATTDKAGRRRLTSTA